MEKINTRQICFFFACLAPAGKLINMPSVIAREAGRGLILSAAINFLLQGAVIFLLLLLSERTRLTFAQLLENTVGRAGKIVVALLFALFFLFAALTPLLEQKSFVQAMFYDSMPALTVFLPFFLFSAFACMKNIRAIGRSADLALSLFTVSAAGLLFLSFGKSDFGTLLPLFTTPAKQVLRGSAFSLNWFLDSAFMLFFLGNFNGSKKSTAWITVSYFIGAFVVLLFLAVFYGVFEGIAPIQRFMILKIAKYYSAISVLGRVDYIFGYIFSIALLFYSVVPLQMCVECLAQSFGEHRFSYSLGVNALMMILIICLNYAEEGVFDLFNKNLFWIFLLFTLVLPPLALLLRREK